MIGAGHRYIAIGRMIDLLSRLLPDASRVRLETWNLDPASSAITLTLRARQRTACCPLCGRRSKRVHSRYERTLADLPWSAYAITVRFKVRRLFCDAPGCARRIFTERLPGVTVPWARRTTRLAGRLTAVGLALGGAAGARLSRALGTMVSRNTLLRLVRRAPQPDRITPSALGVDDWALHKRHTYGTVLVDLDRHRPVALLPNREADTLAAWLREHPGVAVIARDRAGAYAKGAQEGAPAAVQVADRFHLLHNLAEALEVVFTVQSRELRAVEQMRHQAEAAVSGGVVLAPPKPQAKTRALASERRERRQAQHEQVWELHRQGWPTRSIAHHLGLGGTTVFRYLRSELFPERKNRNDKGRSRVDPWQQVVLAHWNAGRRQGRWLFHTLQQQHGYRGSYATLARYLQRLRAAEGTLPAHTRPPAWPRPVLVAAPRRVWTPRTAAWLVLRRVEKRSAAEQAWLAELRRHAPELDEAVALAEEFMGLLRNRTPDRLDPWLQRAQSSTVRQLRSFAQRLWADYDAVRAAVTLDWSSGQTEGQINRLKTIKRQMYGRAGLDLLGRRFLFAS
jgi:transposase